VRTSVLRNRAIVALLTAETVSTTGSQMTWLALPWFVLSTTGSATKMGIVLAAEAAGVALAGIPGGALLARLGARRTMLAVNALAAPLILSIPLLHWAGALTFGLLVTLVFVLGTMWGPYFAAQRVVLSEILGEDEARVSDANALLQAATRVTMLLGPILAGVLIGLIGAPSVLVVDAATFAFALVTIALFVPAAERPAQTEESRGVLAGLRYVARNRLIRAWTITIAVGDAAWNALFATIPFYAFTRYDGNPRVAGLLFACFGVAAVVGNVLSFRIRPRVEARVLIAVGVLAQAAPLWLLTAAGPAWIVALALLLSGLANGVVNPSLHAMLTLVIPPAVRAQALTAVLAVNQLAAPVGFLGAGFILAHYGLDPVFLAVPLVQTVTMGTRALVTLRERRLIPVAAAD
jgi:predicted MFS family arabinose efflux permease